MNQVSLSSFDPLPQGDDQYPLAYMEHRGAIKLKETELTVDVAICDPEDAVLIAQLEAYHQKAVRLHLLDRMELAAFLGKAHSQLADGERYSVAGQDEKLLLDKLANDAPIVNLVNSTVIDAVRRGASDIHIESFEKEAVVRYRIDGALGVVNRLPTSSFPAVSSRLKIMANLNIMERRIPQDGRISVHLGGESIDVRISVVPTVNGESIVLRLLYKRGAPETLEELGLDRETLSVFRSVMNVSHGLILVTGPTGSGKTTTLNACLREMKSDEVKIITIEDPVEYSIHGIDQIQINESIGLTFESLLRRVLRQDPNVIMVGEIRDEATATLAVRAALTGHVVFSTLHTNDAVSSIGRLLDMGVQPYLLAAVLRAVVAQRLVRKPAGGRVGLFEVFRPDDFALELISKGATTAELLDLARRAGMRSLEEDGLEKVERGETTIDEVRKAVYT